MKNNIKVCVIGIDGATFDLIAPWINQGELPNLKSLIESGCSGVLESTIPPISPVAWSSFYTGVNPGKHGIFDFIEKSKTDQRIHFMNRSRCKALPIWWHINKAGYKATVINMPSTYPPDEINGQIISGLDTPSFESDFIFPKELKTELNNSVGEYIIDLNHHPKLIDAPRQYANQMIEMIHMREKTVHYLIKNNPSEFFSVVFTATDRAQHAFWKLIDKDHPGYIPGYEDELLRIFKRVDKAIGTIISVLDDSTNVIIMSDHGMYGVYNSVDVNRWLLSNGFLFLKKSYYAKLNDLYKRFKRRYIRKKDQFIFHHNIDWSRTRAYFIGSWGNIFINVKGKEPYGIVSEGKDYEVIREEIIQGLEQLKDRKTNKNVINKVFKKEEVYHGNCLADSPDLIILWNKGYNSIKTPNENLRKKRNIIQPYKILSGDHGPNGLFIAKSPNLKCGITDMKANIMDLFPTILYMMDIAVPRDTDGKILTELFTEDFLKNKGIKYEDKIYHDDDKEVSSVYSEEDSQKIADRLKDLGYI